MQVDVLHGNDLRISAAGSAALHAEHRAQRGLAQSQHGIFADFTHAVGQRHGNGGLAFAGGGGVDGGHQHQLALHGLILIITLVDLGDITSVGGYGFRRKTGSIGYGFNGLHCCAARDLQITGHLFNTPFVDQKRENDFPALAVMLSIPDLAIVRKGFPNVTISSQCVQETDMCIRYDDSEVIAWQRF